MDISNYKNSWINSQSNLDKIDQFKEDRIKEVGLNHLNQNKSQYYQLH